MVLLLTTDRILAAFEAIPASRHEELDLPTTLEAQGPIAHEQLIRLASYLQTDPEYKASHTPTVLSSLLRGTKVYVPPPPKKPEPSAEYLASKARLLAATEQESYNRLLNPNYRPNADHADPHTSPYTSDGHIEEDTLTISLVSSVFISVIVTGFAVYAALTRFPTPEILASEAAKVLLGLFAALGVAVAEAFLYWTYIGKVERARVKERAIRERKVVIGAVGEDEGVEVGREKEEIWGKGVNGGVRRRVREKWEKGRDVSL
ncbi:ATPase vacuolar ER assembly factor Vma12 [Penicillium cf. griseofulvum]|uniref:ATPase vacuolar ER assembly factor Vma12 n=1 Tax=Penicillium cf. griseofulvum TaxID=2972120 RepID=A0A9W9J3Y3_9EURO|nr:ATPase vacuolar ER assembly factor Vma12 [Penicillium cf. griseofulvum]KAJ5434492.1 ATPase vacuolar ER assembly factor Vma12 [Penicillium cf. griseofulvum]KAJ5452322.1 ATPase vacuolar ER assembly factor Vma12 [Penicillium cf. griseofulvum]